MQVKKEPASLDQGNSSTEKVDEKPLIQETSLKSESLLSQQSQANEQGVNMPMESDTAEPRESKGQKRRKGKQGGWSSKKRKTCLNQQPKNPLMQLNELKPGLQYIFNAPEGPPHDPIFVVTVSIDGVPYTGKGRSKQMAKHEAAGIALKSLEPPVINTSQDFTEDSMEEENFATMDPMKDVVSTPHQDELTPKLQKICSDADKKNPVMMLNSLIPGLTYNLVRENATIPSQRFIMTVNVNGKDYEGFGQNKKLAKAAAARRALSSHYKINFNCPSPVSMTLDGDSEVFSFPEATADSIAKCINDTYNDVMLGEEKYANWNVLAGIAMTTDEAMDVIKIIGIGTGTKHLNGEHMSMMGATVNDCHGEIIARRCLIDFFYTQLENYIEGDAESSIFEKIGEKFRVKPNCKFHLFISTSPCGDGRVFSVHEEDKEVVDRHPNRKIRGLLRVKIESGEGTIPIRSEQSIQTWDGIVQGHQRYVAMSCSDKIASWNIVGLQGALLSKIIEPVYLDSIILGRLFHRNHLYRAVCGRMEGIIGTLPTPYTLNKPKLSPTTSLNTRQISKSPQYSVNWTYGLGKPEIIEVKKGKTISNHVSRLSKRVFFQRFLKIRKVLLEKEEPVQSHFYSTMKKSSESYQNARRQMQRAFLTADMGSWVKKPVEQDEFELTC